MNDFILLQAHLDAMGFFSPSTKRQSVIDSLLNKGLARVLYVPVKNPLKGMEGGMGV